MVVETFIMRVHTFYTLGSLKVEQKMSRKARVTINPPTLKIVLLGMEGVGKSGIINYLFLIKVYLSFRRLQFSG